MKCLAVDGRCRSESCAQDGACLLPELITAREPTEAEVDALNASLLAKYWQECPPYRRPPKADE